MFDHPPGRQIGQFVIIGGAKQLVFERLLAADVGGARDQELAAADRRGPVGREQHLSRRPRVEALLDHRGPSAAQELETGFAALIQLRRLQGVRAADAEPELRRGRIVNQKEIALLVLNRDAGGEQPDDVAQQAQFSLGRAPPIGVGFGGLELFEDETLHVSGF